MLEHLEANPLSLKQVYLLRGVQFCIPRFQRSYCWTEENIDILWSDIESVLSDSGVEAKFLGAIIVKELRGLSGTMVPALDVIDGQQRLITLFLLLCVVAAKCQQVAEEISDSAASEDDNADKLKEKLKTTARTIGKGLLIAFGKDERRPKIEPSFVDMAEFNWALEYLDFLGTDKPKKYELTSDNKKAGALEIAVELMDGRLNRSLEEAGKQAEPASRAMERAAHLERISNEVLDNLEVIEVMLGSRYDPNEVFDRLNLQGQELTVLDLIRNEIFRVFGENSDAAIDFYRERWLPFEKKFEKPFEDLYSDTDTKKYNDRLKHHKKNFWYPFALTLDPSCTSADKRVFKTLQKHWDSMTEEGEILATRILDDLEVFLPVYNAIAAGEKPANTAVDSQIWALVERMHRYEIQAGTYVYLFNLVNHAFNEANAEEVPNIVRCLEMVESYIIRKACLKDDGSVKNVFNSIWSLVRTDPELLVYQLHDTSRPFYEDSKVVESLTEEGFNFYALKRRAKFILFEKEHEHEGDKITWENSNMDHIMPQTYSAGWAHVSEEEHENFHNAIGNLVILTPRSNSSKGDRSWSDTRELYRNESHAHEPKTLCELPQWDTAAIEKRSKELAQWVVTHWPKPEKPAGTLHKALADKLSVLEERVAPRISELELRHAFLKFTKTGSNKHNITATNTISDFLQSADIHDFQSQELGEGAKRAVPVRCFTPSGKEDPVDMTLYRTKTKREKRLWIKGLDSYAGQWSLIALCLVDGELVAVNCSHDPTLNAFLLSQRPA